jgi:hypothetical protein
MDIIKSRRIGILLTILTLAHICICSKLGPGFPLAQVMAFFCVLWFEEQSNCSFCRYWWNCLPSLFDVIFPNQLANLFQKLFKQICARVKMVKRIPILLLLIMSMFCLCGIYWYFYTSKVTGCDQKIQSHSCLRLKWIY